MLCQVQKCMDSNNASFHTKLCVKVKSLTVSPGTLSYMLGKVAHSGCSSTMWPKIFSNSLSGSLRSAILIQASRELAKWLVSVPSHAGDGEIIKEVLWKWPYWGELRWKRGSRAANFHSAICQGSQECVMPGERTDVQPGSVCQIWSLLSVHTFLWDPIGLLWSNNRLFSLTSSNMNVFVNALPCLLGRSL